MIRHLVLPALILAAPAANAGEPLKNIEKVAWERADGKALSLAEVKVRIIRGAAKRNWMPSNAKENSLLLTLTAREHEVCVEVSYTEKEFSITYKSSEKMDYVKDGDGRETIHRKYNAWIRNLVQDIRKELTF